MEIDQRKNCRFSEWAPESDTPYSQDTESEGKETPILGISSSKLHNEFFSSVMKTYAKQKQCGILQLLQQKYRRPELEFQLEEPWLRDYKYNKSFLLYGLLYHRGNHTSSLTVIDRAHISLILQKCHYCPHMGHMSEDRTKERVASTTWWPKWKKDLSEYINNFQESFLGPFTIIKIIGKNAVEVRLTEEFSRKHPICPVSLVKTYFQEGEGRFPSRKKTTTLLEIVEVEDYPGPVNKIIKARKIKHNGKDQRQYLVRFKKTDRRKRQMVVRIGHTRWEPSSKEI
ncbi:hypothetical protein O181_023612 [Austropuccinia psidii MF-1]|uniref:Integrase zinc-binding domain-containing protein n=1 Tax=Austropuccinia psidii MF-1 TaxID=1389203 RepID=A0A9Q3GY66_9BASI|nr:hypothetical protein [Austropuccinia psidii MF-1]